MVFVNKNIIVKNNDAVEQMLNNSSLIRQECGSQNRCYKKKNKQNFRKINISYPLIRSRACTFTWDKKC